MTTLSFTAKQCPNAPGLENTCELPFGMLWTPFAEDSNTIEDNSHDLDSEAALCLHCLAYRNPFVNVLDWDNGVWQCNLCGLKNVVKGQRKQLGDAIENSESNGFEIRDQLYRKPIKRQDTFSVQSEHIADNQSSIHQTSVCYMFVIDLNIPTSQVIAVRDSIRDLLKEKKNDKSSDMLGLIVFDKNLSIYKLGLRGIASAEISKGDVQAFEYCRNTRISRTSTASDASYSSTKLSPTPSLHLVKLSDESSLDIFFECLTAACGGDSSVDSDGNRTTRRKPTRSEVLRLRREARERNKQQSSSKPRNVSDELTHRKKESSKEFRCTGAAIETAIALTKSSECFTGRVVVFTSGMPSIGPGSMIDPYGPKCYTQRVDTFDLHDAARYFREVGVIGMENGIGIDVLCSGKH